MIMMGMSSRKHRMMRTKPNRSTLKRQKDLVARIYSSSGPKTLIRPFCLKI